jgi:DtxR family Mn-dependent transcriptional regulator
LRHARVRACTGAASAAKVAAALERVLPADGAPVVVDGCGWACARRSLEARGIAPFAVMLEEFGVESDEDVRGDALAALRDRILGRLEEQARSTPERLRRTAAGRDVRVMDAPGHTPDDYLYAIRLLTSPVAACGAVVEDWPTTAARIGQALAVTRPTAGEALARLEATGHVVRGPSREVLLTPAGREAASRVVCRHRLVERFLVDVLRYSVAEAYPLALEVRRGMPQVLLDRIAKLVGDAARCPHGWPLDPAGDFELAAGLVAVSSLPPEASGVVVALVEEDAGVLARLAGLGVVPGARISVRAQAPRTAVLVEGRDVELPRADAEATLVARSTEPDRVL